MGRKCLMLLLALFMVFFGAAKVAAHCEIPCGIYDDEMRIKMIAEHITTIEKGMNQIMELQGQKPMNHNQLARWVMNKEKHANELQHIVTQYFMTQRIKPGQDKYTEKVIVLHKMLLAAMKCKQTTDMTHVDALRALLKDFEKLYFSHGHE